MLLEIKVEDYTDTSSAMYAALKPTKSRALQKWRYQEHPSGVPGLIGYGSLNDEPVAMTPFVPARMMGGAKGFQAVDTIALDRARGKNAFVRIGAETMREAEQRGVVCVYGFPNAIAARGWYSRRLRWTPMGTAPFLFRPVRTGFFLKRLLGKGLADFPIPRFGRRLQDAQEISRFTKADDGVWSSFSTDIYAALERDHEYLNWRLFQKPEDEYSVLGVPGPDGLNAFGASHLADKHGGRVGYVMEALARPDSIKILPNLINELVLRMDKPDVVFAWCFPHSPNYQAYRRAGFWPMPDRIRPIEINFGAISLNGSSEAFTKRENWYLSYLDSDTV